MKYLLIAKIEGNNNLIVLYEDEDLEKIKEAKKIIEEIEEWGPYEDMIHAADVVEKVEELSKYSINWWESDSPLIRGTSEYLPKIESLVINKIICDDNGNA